MKKLIYVLLVLIVILVLLYVNNIFNILQFNKPVEEFVAFNTENIVETENLVIDAVTKIDDKNFLLQYREVKPITGYDDNNLMVTVKIYKYNLETGLNKNSIKIDNGCYFLGVDKTKDMAYFIGTDYYNEELYGVNVYPTFLYNINYKTMQLENTSEDVGYKYNIKISSENKYWTYNTDEGLFVSEPCFENPKILFKTMISNDDVRDSESCHPSDFIGDKIIYLKCGYEWVKGIGIVNIDGTNNKFVSINDAGYLLYDNESSIYYVNVYENMPLMKLNIDTLEQTEVFNVEQTENEKLHYVSYLSSDAKYIAVVVEDYSNPEKNKVYVDVYNVNTKEKLNTYELTGNDYNYVTNIEFIKDSMILVESANKINIWNFNK